MNIVPAKEYNCLDVMQCSTCKGVFHAKCLRDVVLHKEVCSIKEEHWKVSRCPTCREDRNCLGPYKKHSKCLVCEDVLPDRAAKDIVRCYVSGCRFSVHKQCCVASGTIDKNTIVYCKPCYDTMLVLDQRAIWIKADHNKSSL